MAGQRETGPKNARLRRRRSARVDSTATGKRDAPAADDAIGIKLEVLAELVPQLARAIAPNCEVVLHDNRALPPRILAIGNGHVSGRDIGDFMTRVALDGVEASNVREPLFNYPARTPDGRQVRASLLPIMHDQTVIAYIAVSFVVQDLLLARQAINFLLKTEQAPARIQDPFFATRDLSRVFDECLQAHGGVATLLSHREKVALVRRLKKRGIFGMRGAVQEVAERMGLSRTAIYNYLNEIDKEEYAVSRRRSPRAKGARARKPGWHFGGED